MLLFASLLLGSAAQAGPLPGSVAVTSPQEAPEVWLGDIDAARRLAHEEGKHVLIDFTGTGWCSWCKRLDDQVLSTGLFQDTMAARFVLVRVDFDAEGNARRDLPHADKNDALKKALGVDGFPRVVLMTSAGVPYGELGYERGGAGPYVDKLSGLHEKAKHLEKAVPAAAAALSAAKSKEEAAAAADAAVALLREAGPHALGAPLVPLARAVLDGEALPLDREQAAILALSSANAVDDPLIDRAFRVDPNNQAGVPEAALAAAIRTVDSAAAVGPLIQRIEEFLENVIVHDPQVAAQLYGDCAYYIKNWQNDADRARMMASFALRLEPKEKALRDMLRDLAGH